MGIMDKARSFLTGSPAPLKGGGGDRPSIRGQYFNSLSGGVSALNAWRPALRDAGDDVATGYLDAAARAIDLMHNSGWIAGGIEQGISKIIGAGLRLAPRPDRVILGWDEKKAQEWANLVERRYILRAENPIECDAAGKHTIAELTEQFCRIWYAYGEGVALAPAIRRSGSTGKTKIQLVLPHRLSQDTNELMRLHQGVFVDAYGCPQGYRFTNKHGIHSDVAARDRIGRSQVSHIFKGLPSQTRGISVMAPVFAVLRQFDQLADATLTNNLLQTIFAATIESDEPSENLLAAFNEQSLNEGRAGGALDSFFGLKEEWASGKNLNLGIGGKVVTLMNGERLKFTKTENVNGNYETFARFLLRESARAIGLTYEEFTGDYNGITYTGARLGTSAYWPLTMSRRRLPARFLQHDYEAWLEEEIEAGLIPFDGGLQGFLANKRAACSAAWRGPPKPQADDLKSAKAHEIYRGLGLMTDEDICDDLGSDWDDNYEQLARERERREKLGIEPKVPDPSGEVVVSGEENEEGEDDE